MHPTPGLSTSRQLAADVLVSLGKRFDALQTERAGARAWSLVDVWIAAERVQHLFVLRAHLLGPKRWHDLLDLGPRLKVEVWFVVHPDIPARIQRCLADTAFRRWDPATFAAHWRDTSADDDRTSRGSDFLEIPAEDFVTFRSACRRLLDPAAFERVDAVFCDSMDRRRLSRIIDADLNEITQTPYLPPDRGGNDGDLGDDIRVEAALAEFVDGTTRDALADAFGWPLARVERALAVLEVRLRPSGRRLRQIGWHPYTLGPNLAILSTAERAQLIRSTAAENLDQDEADTLYLVLRGYGAVGLITRGLGEAAAQSLERQGLVLRRRGHYQLSADVTFSLRLAD